MKVFKTQKFYQTLTIFLWLVFLATLILTGKLKIFIKKYYSPFTISGTIILLILFIIKLKRFKKEHSEPINFMAGVSFLAFLFPVIITAIVRPGNLSSFAASKRGISTSYQAGNILEVLKSSVETEGKYKKLTIKQLIAFAEKKKEVIDGKEVAVEGLVYKIKGEKTRFIIVRFLITCCAADATPLGITVNYAKADELKQDTWIKVYGKCVVTNKKPLIIAEKVEKKPAPSDPYLY